MSLANGLKVLTTETLTATTLNGDPLPPAGSWNGLNMVPLYSAIVSPAIVNYNSLGAPAPLPPGAFVNIPNFHPNITTNSVMTAVCLGGSGLGTDKVKGAITEIDGNANTSITICVLDIPTNPLNYLVQVWRW